MTPTLRSWIQAIVLSLLSTQYRRVEIVTSNSPAPAAPYSQAIQVGQTVYVTGTIGTYPSTGLMVPGGTVEQARRALMNSLAILQAAGMTFSDVTKVTIFLTNLNDLPAVNNVYKTYFQKPYPARSSVQVTRIPYDARIMIEMIAVGNGRSSSYFP